MTGSKPILFILSKNVIAYALAGRERSVRSRLSAKLVYTTMPTSGSENAIGTNVFSSSGNGVLVTP